MNKPYATLDIESVDSDQYNVLLDAESSGDEFSVYYPVVQFETVQGSVIIDIITDSLSNSGYPAELGDTATLIGLSQSIGGIPASALNGVAFPIVEFRYDSVSPSLITGVRVDIGATTNATAVVTVTNVNVTYKTPLSIMPAGRIRFFFMNNKIYVRYFDGSVNKYAAISNLLQQY